MGAAETIIDLCVPMRMKPFTKILANWLNNDFMGMCKKRKLHPSTCGISPEEFADLVGLHYIGLLSRDETRVALHARLEKLWPSAKL